MKKILLLFVILFGMFCIFCNSANAELYTDPHWVKSPISVYIPKNRNQKVMQKAFEAWQERCYGQLKFNFVEKGPADIDVVFTNKVNGSDGPLGAYKLTIKNNNIAKAEIHIATEGTKKYSDDYIYTTMLHEVGHALGMSHNPRKKSSIMFSPVSETVDIIQVDIVRLFKISHWSWREKEKGN